MKKTVNIHSLSLEGYCLPTFQKATLEVTGYLWWKKKFLEFSHYPNFDTTKELETIKIQVK